ncbi:MAG: trypsin-like peptidase domain-containing protein [Oscillospiraceae bacterium]|nr:trypsin-like peptidase domain-containing protein [Oscillospiraceae bacterium]
MFTPELKNEKTASEIETEKSQNTPKYKKAVKALSCLCLIAAVSCGSIASYRYIADAGKNSTQNSTASVESSDDTQNVLTDKSSSVLTESYSTQSLSQLSKSENALSIQDIYKKVLPSVVGITSSFEVQSASSQYNRYFGSGEGQLNGQTVKGTGTGIVMSQDGYIITNAHVIYDSSYGAAKDVTVLLSDTETEYTAEVVGYDTQTDIAVLKVNANDLTAAELGDSSTLEVGDTAIAIGNPLGFDLFGTMTAGYISGLNRTISTDDSIMHLIQTDAAINSGNSGGPLVNDCGQIIGINSMKMSSSYSSNEASIEGLGFAIPINEAKEIVTDLMQYGYVKGRPQLGISCRDVTASTAQFYAQENTQAASGVLIVDVTADSAAQKSGLQVGDIIVGVDDQQISTITQLNSLKNEKHAGDTIKLTVLRSNQYLDFNVTLEEVTSD